jgi:uncharacterized membrane protein
VLAVLWRSAPAGRRCCWGAATTLVLVCLAIWAAVTAALARTAGLLSPVLRRLADRTVRRVQPERR